MKIAIKVLDLWLGTSLGPNYQFLSPRPIIAPDPDILVKHFIQLSILHKIRPCLRKLDQGFWTYGCVNLLIPIDPKLVLRPQTPKVIYLPHEKYFL